jgi:inhibitor of cysteine peptidase
MKSRSLFLVVAAVMVVLLAAGCARAEPLTLGEKDTGRTVDLSAGQKLIVRLPSNATTGFQWVVADAGPMTQLGDPVYKAPEGSGAVGASGTQVFTFAAGSSGAGELKLEYRRPWEKNVPAEKTWSVTLK